MLRTCGLTLFLFRWCSEGELSLRVSRSAHEQTVFATFTGELPSVVCSYGTASKASGTNRVEDICNARVRNVAVLYFLENALGLAHVYVGVNVGCRAYPERSANVYSMFQHVVSHGALALPIFALVQNNFGLCVLLVVLSMHLLLFCWHGVFFFFLYLIASRIPPGQG